MCAPTYSVIPAKAGIQISFLDPRIREGDDPLEKRVHREI